MAHAVKLVRGGIRLTLVGLGLTIALTAVAAITDPVWWMGDGDRDEVRAFAHHRLGIEPRSFVLIGRHTTSIARTNIRIVWSEVDDAGKPAVCSATIFELGFPFRWLDAVSRDDSGAPVYEGFVPFKFVGGENAAVEKALLIPATPRLGGLVANVALLGIVAALFRLVANGVIRRRRLRRGLCGFCKYPVGDSARCTECGCQLPRSRGARSNWTQIVVVRAAGSLFVGGILAIGLAWACALYSPLEPRPATPRAAQPSGAIRFPWQVVSRSDEALFDDGIRGFGVRFEYKWREGPSGGGCIETCLAGWPLPGLRGSLVKRNLEPIDGVVLTNPLEEPGLPSDQRAVLPLVPLWRNLLLNATVFAIPIFLVLIGLATVSYRSARSSRT